MSDDPDTLSPAADAPVAPDPASVLLLSQMDIDGLTGFVAPRAPERAGGLRGVVDAPAAPRDAMPMLDVVVARFVAAAGQALAGLLGEGVEVARRSVRTERYGSLLDALDQPAQIFVLRAEGWGGEAALVVGPGVVFMLLDRLLGAGGSGGTRRVQDRAPTPLERALLGKAAALVVGAAGEAFGSLAPVRFAVERAEADPYAARLAGPADAVLTVSVELRIEGVSAEMSLLLPLSTLAPVRDRLGESFFGEESGPDDPWGEHLATALWTAPTGVEAVLHEMQLPLGRVIRLGIGDTLMFDRKPGDLVAVRCGGVTITRGRLGQMDGRIAVQVAETLHPSAAGRPLPARS